MCHAKHKQSSARSGFAGLRISTLDSLKSRKPPSGGFRTAGLGFNKTMARTTTMGFNSALASFSIPRATLIVKDS